MGILAVANKGRMPLATPVTVGVFVGLAACGDVQPGGGSYATDARHASDASHPLGFSGSASDDVSTAFVLTVVNDTPEDQFVTLFQDHFGTGATNVVPLVWKTVEVAADAEVELQWTENYSFNWSSSVLSPGSTYVVNQSVEAGTVLDNDISLSDASGTAMFEGLTEGPMSNELTIHVESPDASFVGVGLAGTPIYAASAVMNQTQIFDALDPDYFISSGTDYEVGQPIDLDALSLDAFESFSSADGARLVATLSESAGEFEFMWTIERE